MKNLSIPISIAIAGLIIAGAVFYKKEPKAGNNIPQPPLENKQAPNQPLNLKIDNLDHVLGSPDAELTIFEYSDTECPACKSFYKATKQIMNEYGKEGKVRWVYRHFPLDSRHDKARKEAEATECANELGGNEKFWEYLDRLYEITPSNNLLEPAKLFEIAAYVGINSDDFSKCLNSGRHAKKVEKDYQSGISAGVEGTPYSIIVAKNNDKFPLFGALPYEEFKLGIDQLLERKASK
jgi:protein-disulfide isomerase